MWGNGDEAEGAPGDWPERSVHGEARPVIDMRHPRVRLAQRIDWGFLEREFGAVYTDGPGAPPLPTRLMAGLHILIYSENLSDERLCEVWATAVGVDTTVQPKNVAHTTDAKLSNRARERLVRLARKHGVALRQSYGQARAHQAAALPPCEAVQAREQELTDAQHLSSAHDPRNPAQDSRRRGVEGRLSLSP